MRFFLICFLFFSVKIVANAQSSEDLPWAAEGIHGSELALVFPFLSENPNILEAGAHYGEDTVILSRKWPKGTVYAFEPCPHSFQMLKSSTQDFKNVKIFPFGLFSTTGRVKFNINVITDGSSSLFSDNHIPGVTWYRDSPTLIYCMNLDEWAASEDVDHIDYMWLDMEGAELAMLTAAPKILNTVRAISTEVNFREFRKGMAQFADMRAFLERNGFTLYKIWGVRDWQGTAVFIRDKNQ